MKENIIYRFNFENLQNVYIQEKCRKIGNIEEMFTKCAIKYGQQKLSPKTGAKPSLHQSSKRNMNYTVVTTGASAY